MLLGLGVSADKHCAQVDGACNGNSALAVTTVTVAGTAPPLQLRMDRGARIWGRFDDVLGGTAMSFDQPFRLLIARTPEEVVPVLAEVDRETRSGCWAFGFVAYEAAGGLDPRWTVGPPPAPEGLPLAWFGLCREVALVPPVAVPAGRLRDYRMDTWRWGWTEPGYRAQVDRVRDVIAAGDTYQCNLTVRLHGRVTGDLEQLYADLVWSQGGSHAAFLDIGEHVIAGASPELFFEWVGDHLLTRPMKGTAARGRWPAEDAQQLRRLQCSEKERAENVMIVDLLRNDLSQIADVGTVRVPILFAPEPYETVWQLTSDVRAKVPAETGLVDVFRALFPSGSVTGAPKQRTMELIAELEPEPRGVYCGAVGVVAPPGQAFRALFNVAIRTVTVERATGRAAYGTGGGITWGSDAKAEHAELLIKSKILLEPYEDFALFETMAQQLPDSGLRNLDRHLRRLADSAAYFGFPFDELVTRARLAREVPNTAGVRVRLTLGRTGQLDVTVGPAPARSDRPVRLALEPEPVDSSQRWLFHKTTRRDVYTSRAARHPAADDVAMVNERSEVTETTIANLAVQLDGIWWTPPLAAGCLPGVERGRLLDLGQLQERTLSPADLMEADELAVLSSLRGWRSAVLVPQASASVGSRADRRR